MAKRKQLKEELDRFHSLSNDLICIAGMDGYFKFVNPAWEKILGYTEAELLDKPFIDFIHPDDHPKNDAEVKKLTAGHQTLDFENRYLHKDGSIRIISWTAAPLPKEKLLYCIGRDVTGRKRMEEKLHREHAYNLAILKAVPDIIMEVDEHKVYTWANQAGLEFFGDDVLGHEAADYFVGEQQTYDKVEYLFDGEEGLMYVESWQRRKDGAERLLAWWCRALKDEAGKVTGALSTARDITDQKQIEERVKLLSLVAEQSKEGIAIADLDGKLTFVNQAWAAMHGYQSGNDLLGKNLSVLHTPEQLEHDVIPFNKKVIEEGHFEGEVGHQRQDGTTFPTFMVTTLLKDSQGQALAFAATAHDITEQKLAEEEILKFKTISDTANYGAAISDPEGIMTYVNEAYAAMHDMTQEEMIGQHIGIVHIEEQLPRMHELLKELMKNGSAHAEVVWHAKKGGEVFPTLMNANVIYDEQGRPQLLTATAIDITERRLAEEALRESEEYLRSVLRAAPVGIGVVSNRLLKQVNTRLCEMVGYAAEELREQSARILYPSEEDYEYVGREKYRQISEHGTGTVETRWKCKDGRVINVLLSSTPLDQNDLVKGVTFTALDITEQKRAEQALLESEERYRKLVESSPDAIIIHNGDKVVFVNPAAEELFEGGASDIIGKPIMEFVHPDYRDRVRQRANSTLQDRVDGPRVEEKMLSLAGNEFDVDVIARPFTFRDQPMVQVVLRNITRHKQLEAQLRQAQKMEAVGQLAGGVAHDFNNILQAIMGYISLAQKDLEPGSTVYQDISQVQKISEKAARLTKQLLAFSRRQILEPSYLDLNQVIEETMKLLQRVLGEGIEIDVIPGHNLGSVYSDLAQIEQILLNLSVNARDAMEGKGKLTIETENVLIDGIFCETHPWAEPGRYVMLSVTDTGCGMEKEILERIFEPFFTTKEEGEGTGLGLSMVFGIIKQHGGLIHAYSEVGHGTTFKLYLPLVSREAKMIDSKIEESIPRGSETILLVEDDDNIREVTKRMLENNGYTILAAADGAEALSICKKHLDEIEMALLDVVLPKMSGKQVRDQVLELKPQLPILFCSGYCGNNIHTQFILDEEVELVQKPYQPDVLLRKIRKCLEAGQRSKD